jgi:hypothetical protein
LPATPFVSLTPLLAAAALWHRGVGAVREDLPPRGSGRPCPRAPGRGA